MVQPSPDVRKQLPSNTDFTVYVLFRSVSASFIGSDLLTSLVSRVIVIQKPSGNMLRYISQEIMSILSCYLLFCPTNYLFSAAVIKIILSSGWSNNAKINHN
jgi:hypothetical protein